jgi:hypothetical protein
VLTQILLAHYFGRASFGAISGVLEPFHKGGLGIGALIAGVGFDLFGDYRAVFVGFLSMYLLSALLIYWAGRPERGSD